MKQNVTGLQWMAGDGWTTNYEIQTPEFMPYLQGILGVDIRHGEIPGLKDFLLKIHPETGPDNSPDNTIVSLVFNLQYFKYSENTSCSGDECLAKIADLQAHNPSQLRMIVSCYSWQRDVM